MSHYDYQASKKISAEGYPFYALVMAAMRQADTYNGARLERAFPKVRAELEARYNAPGGLLSGESAPQPVNGVCDEYADDDNDDDLPF